MDDPIDIDDYTGDKLPVLFRTGSTSRLPFCPLPLSNDQPAYIMDISASLTVEASKLHWLRKVNEFQEVAGSFVEILVLSRCTLTVSRASRRGIGVLGEKIPSESLLIVYI